MRTFEQTFGIDPIQQAMEWNASPLTSATPPIVTVEEATLQPARSPVSALLDPRGSALFWIALASVLGLLLVSGELKVAAAVRGRAGK